MRIIAWAPALAVSALTVRTTALHEHGNLSDGPADQCLVDLRAAYNAVHDPDLANGETWTPTLFLPLDEARRVLPLVLGHSGPFPW